MKKASLQCWQCAAIGRLCQDSLEVQEVTCWVPSPEYDGITTGGGGGGASAGHVLQLPSQ